MTSSDSFENRTVVVGMRVRVAAVSDSLLANVPDDEVTRVKSMLGQVLEVDQIDDRGRPWVTQWFGEGSQPAACSHRLALGRGEFEIVY